MDAVAGADVANLRCDFGIAPRRHVRKQVVFDLVAQVAGHKMEPASAFQIARALDLAQIPATAAFVFGFFQGEDLRIGGEMAAENHGVGPHVTDAVGNQIAEQYARPLPECQERKQQVILDQLRTGFFHERFTYIDREIK